MADQRWMGHGGPAVDGAWWTSGDQDCGLSCGIDLFDPICDAVSLVFGEVASVFYLREMVSGQVAALFVSFPSQECQSVDSQASQRKG